MARYVPAKWNNAQHLSNRALNNSEKGIRRAAKKNGGSGAIDIDTNCTKDMQHACTHWLSLAREKFRWTEESFKIGACTKAQIGTVCQKKTTDLTMHQISTLRTAEGLQIISLGRALTIAAEDGTRVEHEYKFTPTQRMVDNATGVAKREYGKGWRLKYQVKQLKQFGWRFTLRRAKKAGAITFLLGVRTGNQPWYVDFYRKPVGG